MKMNFLENMKNFIKKITLKLNFFSNNNNNNFNNPGKIIVYLQTSDSDIKKIPLSKDERHILEVLAEGAELTCAMDERGVNIDVRAYGTEEALTIDPCVLYKNYKGLLRKGLLQRISDSHYAISPAGIRTIQKLDLQNS
ncbi:MAG: YjhX family toxin [Victivallales bacterium]